MQLYSEEKDWAKLVEVVLQLADFVDDKKQRAKYMHTAAMVSARQLGEVDVALDYLRTRPRARPHAQERALEEAIELRTAEGGLSTGSRRFLKMKLDQANDDNDQVKMLETFEELGAALSQEVRLIERGDRRLRGGAGARSREQAARRHARRALCVRSGAVPRQGGERARADPAAQPDRAGSLQAAPQVSTPKPSEPTRRGACARRCTC